MYSKIKPKALDTCIATGTIKGYTAYFLRKSLESLYTILLNNTYIGNL